MVRWRAETCCSENTVLVLCVTESFFLFSAPAGMNHSELPGWLWGRCEDRALGVWGRFAGRYLNVLEIENAWIYTYTPCTHFQTHYYVTFTRNKWMNNPLKFALWVLTPRRQHGGYQRFGGTYCLHLQGRHIQKSWRHCWLPRSRYLTLEVGFAGDRPLDVHNQKPVYSC